MAAAACLVIACLALPCRAQELQPRRWGHLPIDTNFGGVGYAYTGADVAFDPVLLIEDVSLELHTLPLKYIRTFELAGKSARIDLVQAYQDAEWNGLLDGVPARATRSGWSDTFLRFAVNIIGAPPLRGAEYAEYRAATKIETIVGLALEVQLPTGQYFNDKLLNLGTNRVHLPPPVRSRAQARQVVNGTARFILDLHGQRRVLQRELSRAESSLYDSGICRLHFPAGTLGRWRNRLWLGREINHQRNPQGRSEGRHSLGAHPRLPDLETDWEAKSPISLSERRRRWVSTRTALWQHCPCAGNADVTHTESGIPGDNPGELRLPGRLRCALRSAHVVVFLMESDIAI